tara:strand:+ start:497 stop:613 length:117 start_codon:yes stop_codon:yes gene_type:complete
MSDTTRGRERAEATSRDSKEELERVIKRGNKWREGGEQ